MLSFIINGQVLLVLYMNSKSQFPIYNNASFDNFDFKSEETHCTPTNSMMHNFLNVPKIMDYENILYFIAMSQNFHP
jgi:hypothetical protein